MSATGRTEGLREADDFYETPAWATRAILPHLEMVSAEARTVLDPFAGRGAILEVVRESWPAHRLVALELNSERAVEALRLVTNGACCDSLGDGHAWPSAHIVLTNPPYKHAEAAIRRAHAEVVVRGGEAAFLLRVNFLGSEKRAAFHRQFPSDVFILPRRPSFALSWKCAECGRSGLVGKRSDGTLMGEVPKECPGMIQRSDATVNDCRGPIRTSSSDATEYAWFVWGPLRGGRWSILDVEG